MAKSTKPIDADQFLRVLESVNNHALALAQKIRPANVYGDTTTRELAEWLASNRSTGKIDLKLAAKRAALAGTVEGAAFESSLAAHRSTVEAKRLDAVKAFLRSRNLDVETLLHYAAAGFLACDAVVASAERSFESQSLLLGGLRERQGRKRSEHARENRSKGKGQAFTDAELLAHRDRFVAAHRGSDYGWRKAAALEFEVADTLISRRYRKISELT